MFITEVKLENFKNYDSQVFRFEPGTNSISGPNGSGKTSIIEAISWALFDYIPYSQDNIVKTTRSENHSGQTATNVARVTVSFKSDLDKKEYTVSRSTRSQYYVVDCETNDRIAENKREVLPFLLKHYNLGSTTKLEELFTNTIGVPQGMFTAIFLDTPINRKKVFDKILNIEDYRNAYDDLKSFKTFLKDKLSDLNLKIAAYSSDINRIPEVIEEINILTSDIKSLEEKIKTLHEGITSLTESFNTLEKQSKAIEKLKNNIEKLLLSINHLEQDLTKSNQLLKEALEASDKIKSLKSKYDDYLSLKKELTEIETKRDNVHKLNTAINKLEKDLQNVTTDLQNYNEKLERNKKIKTEIKGFEPQLETQRSLEIEKQQLEKKKTFITEQETILKYDQLELNRVQSQLKAFENDLAKIDKVKELAKSLDEINEQVLVLQKNINETGSQLKEHKEMSCQVKGGLCPFLKEPCKNISDGQDLESYFKEKISELDNIQKADMKEFIQLEASLKTSQKAKEDFHKLLQIEKEMDKLLPKVQELQDKIAITKHGLKGLESVHINFEKITKEIKKLGSPADRINLLSKQLEDEAGLNKSIALAQDKKAEYEQKIKENNETINKLGFDETLYQKIRANLHNLETIYHSYLKLETIANNMDPLRSQTAILMNEKIKAQEELTTFKTQLEELHKQYDSDRHQECLKSLDSNKLEHTRFLEQKNHKGNTLKQLNSKLSELLKTKESLEKEQIEVDRLNDLLNFIDFARDIFKDCGPHIGKIYIDIISEEANKLYQTITGHYNQNLQWGIDYEISVEEGGFSRTFANLSGGEQMAAALAVRLTMLRELSDINVAFFDEPTTNMDELRRLNLAEQIKNITDFDQLFIISHDDTFERDIDNVIRLG